jgi:hypothetical protein
MGTIHVGNWHIIFIMAHLFLTVFEKQDMTNITRNRDDAVVESLLGVGACDFLFFDSNASMPCYGT